MTKFQSYKCNECPAIKDEGNHWFLIFIVSGVIQVHRRWNEEAAKGDGAIHLCGDACVIKFVSRSLGTKEAA